MPPDAAGIYGPGETLAYASHRVLGRDALAREFPRSMISARPFANAIAAPTQAFERHRAASFATWRLDVRGLVARPASLSLADLRTMPTRSQITAVTCEEGWSYVAEWTGTPLAAVLGAAGVHPTARYVVYYSSDPEWWESIDLDEGMHPQTLVTWGMNGADLPVPFGGPLRLRVPRQLGYKSVKFLDRIVVTDSLDDFGDGSSRPPTTATRGTRGSERRSHDSRVGTCRPRGSEPPRRQDWLPSLDTPAESTTADSERLPR